MAGCYSLVKESLSGEQVAQRVCGQPPDPWRDVGPWPLVCRRSWCQQRGKTAVSCHMSLLCPGRCCRQQDTHSHHSHRSHHSHTAGVGTAVIAMSVGLLSFSNPPAPRCDGLPRCFAPGPGLRSFWGLWDWIEGNEQKAPLGRWSSGSV